MDVVLGGKELWESADILVFTETWEYSGNSLPTLDGFQCIGSILNERRFNTGRGFGGVAVYARTHLQSVVHMEEKDLALQYLVVRLKTRGTPSSFITS